MRKPTDPINSPHIFEPTRDEWEHYIGFDPSLDPDCDPYWEPQFQLSSLPKDAAVRDIQESSKRMLGQAKPNHARTVKEISQFMTELLWIDKVIRDAHATRNKLLSNLSYDAKEILTKEWVHFKKDNEMYQLQDEELVVNRRIELERVEPVRIQEELYDLDPPGDAPQEHDKPEPPADHTAVLTRDQHPETVEVEAANQGKAPEVPPPATKKAFDPDNARRKWHAVCSELNIPHLTKRAILGVESHKDAAPEHLEFMARFLKTTEGWKGYNSIKVAVAKEELLDRFSRMPQSVQDALRYWKEHRERSFEVSATPREGDA